MVRRKANLLNLLWCFQTFALPLHGTTEEEILHSYRACQLLENVNSQPGVTRGLHFTAYPQNEGWKSSARSKKPARNHIQTYLWIFSRLF